MIWLAASAFAWSEIGATWAPDAMPIPYWVASDVGPLDDAAVVAATQAAFATWEAAGCGVSFAYQGRADDATYGVGPDGKNVVFVFGAGWPADPTLATDERLVLDGIRILEGDIGLNAESFEWATEGADGVAVLDVQSGVTHELGHVLGLSHVDVPGATLNPALIGHPDANDLAQDDLDGLCTLYGRGDADVGDPCGEERDCLEGLLCLADEGQRYCTSTCETDADCPTDFTCEAAGDDSVCAAAAAGCGCATGGSPLAGLGVLALAAGVVRHRRRCVSAHPSQA